MKTGIYKIENLENGHIYVGSSKDIKKRWSQHRYNLKNNKHCNPKLQNAWNKYKEDAFKFMIIEEVATPNKKLLFEAEQWWYEALNPDYNLCSIAGSTLGYQHTEEAKQKISISQKGKILSREHKQKISLANKGKIFSEEHRQNLSKNHCDISGENNPMYGKAFTEKHRHNISVSLKGENHPNYGKPRPAETRKKISKGNSGERGSTAKLTWEKVEKIREMYVIEKKSQGEIALLFGIARSNISLIVNNKSWKPEDNPNNINNDQQYQEK